MHIMINYGKINCFIYEFDSTKTVVIDQIIEDGLKNKIDVVSLFVDLHLFGL